MVICIGPTKLQVRLVPEITQFDIN